MKATLLSCTALLLLGAAASVAEANPYYPCPTIPRAPDACGPGYYVTNPCGMVYGPNYNIYPPFPPFNGLLPPLNKQPRSFSTHPYARSPRDYFMID